MKRLDLSKYVHPYVEVSIVERHNGFLVYRQATGDNVELLHIKTYVTGVGTGRQLVLAMLEELKQRPPYCTVFGFTRTCNEASQKFYTALGFELTPVKGVYQDGSAVLFSQEYKTLLEFNNVN